MLASWLRSLCLIAVIVFLFNTDRQIINSFERKLNYSLSEATDRARLSAAQSGAPGSGKMSNITVSSSAELLSALAAASSGDTIMLAPGSYAGLAFRNMHFADGVTITSADPANPAKILDLLVRDSSGFNFSNLEFDSSAHTVDSRFQVNGSNDVHFTNIYVHGSLDGNAANEVAPFFIRSSTNVSVVDSEFEQVTHAIGIAFSEHVLIEGNSFHDIRSDGVRTAGSSHVTISGNHFTDFYPIAGDHADAIQFWTTGMTTVAHDITVTDNLIVRGDGGWIQGIFFRDEVGTLPYENVVIANNMIIGSSWNGIALLGAANVQISNNILASVGEEVSRIRLEGVNGAVLTDNSAGAFLLSVRNTGITSTGSNVIMPSPDQVEQLLADWLAAHSDSTDGGTGDGTDDGSGEGTGDGTGDGTGGTTDPGPTTDGAYVRAVFGTLGDDTMDVSGSGAVRLVSLAGNDTLTDAAGVTCWLEGGAGDDLYFVNGATTTVTEKLGEGLDIVRASVDFCLSEEVEVLELEGKAQIGTGNGLDNVLRGTGAHNVLTGLDGDDKIFAGHGDDELDGGLGNDLLDGGGGSDVLRGGAGSDVLTGASGDDLLYGGEGRDVFVYSRDDVARRNGPVDTIMDYSGDLIDLSGIDALARTKANDAFTFIGESAFTKVAGQLRVYDDGENTYLSGDVDGNGIADFELCLVGVHSADSLDLLL